MENDNYKEKEIVYQSNRALQIVMVKPTETKIIKKYSRNRFWRFVPKEHVFKKIGDPNGMLICDLGCGEGVISTQLALLGARVTAIDISHDLIEVAERRAGLDGVKNRIEFVIADAESYVFPEEKFDCLITYEVLHHILNIETVMRKIIRSTKIGGKVIIVEPIARSKLLRRIRNLVPVKKDGDSGDRQLSAEEIKLILSHFEEYEIRFFRLFCRFDRLFGKDGVVREIGTLCLNILDFLIQTILPQLRKFCGVVVIIGTRSRKDGTLDVRL